MNKYMKNKLTKCIPHTTRDGGFNRTKAIMLVKHEHSNTQYKKDPYDYQYKLQGFFHTTTPT